MLPAALLFFEKKPFLLLHLTYILHHLPKPILIMTFLPVNYKTKQTILDSFDQIANKISNEVQLKINDDLYRIVVFEFYT